MTNAAKPGSTEELAALLPGVTRVPVKVRRVDSAAMDDAEVEVAEMSIEQLARVARALAPLKDSAVAAASLWEFASEHPDTAFAAIAIAIQWPQERVSRLGGASFLRVLDAVYAANADFFGPLLLRLASVIRPLTATQASGDGERPSPTSGSTDASSTPSA